MLGGALADNFRYSSRRSHDDCEINGLRYIRDFGVGGTAENRGTGRIHRKDRKRRIRSVEILEHYSANASRTFSGADQRYTAWPKKDVKGGGHFTCGGSWFLGQHGVV